MNQRSFSLKFERQIVGEFLIGESHPTQLYRRYNITQNVICYWKKHSIRDKFNNESIDGGALQT